MRFAFFFSTVAFCFFSAMAFSVCARIFSGSSRRAAFERNRVLEAVFFVFCVLLAAWSFGTLLFVSSPSEEEALLWFRVFAFSWYLTPGTFVVFALALQGGMLRVPFAVLSYAPGLVVLGAHLLDPDSVVAAASAVSGGWHAVYPPTVWSKLNMANTVAVPLAAALVLARVASASSDRRRRAQAGTVLAFFAPTFLLSFGTGVAARIFGVDDLPPLAPAFFTILVVGLHLAVSRYGLLDLTPTTAAKGMWSSVSDGVVLASLDGTVIDSNLAGGSRNGKLGAFVEGVEDAPTDWLSARCAAVPEFESIFAFEQSGTRPAALRVRTVHDATGTIGYILTARDLSAEKSLARESVLSSERAVALHSAEENFSRVFRQSPAGTIIAELGTSILLDVNEAACRVAEKTREELIGRDMWTLGLALAPEILEDIRSALRKGRSVGTREIVLNREGSSPLVLAAAVSPMKFDGRNAALVSFIDISELSFLRRKLFQAQKMESIGMMAAGLAHDFNNIMTAIMGNVNLARLSVDETGEVADALSSAETACARARDLSRQLLIYARGGLPSPKAQDLFEVALETTRMALSGSSVAVSFSSEPDLPPSRFDRTQIAMVFNNLALNAVNAMPSGGSLRVRGFPRRFDRFDCGDEAPGDYVAVEFADEGRGLAPEYLSRVFDPYATGKKNIGGLGLAICDSIVKRHKGWIRVESSPGKGSVFTVYLPAAAATEEEASGEPRQGLGDGRALRMGRGAILLMDDEFAIRSMAERLLSRLGYEATVVPDGRAALDAFMEARANGRPFRAVILDLTVPGGMNGVDAASLIRSADPSVPIYVSSGYEDGPVLNDYSSFGFTGLISKPYSLEELSARLSGVR